MINVAYNILEKSYYNRYLKYIAYLFNLFNLYNIINKVFYVCIYNMILFSYPCTQKEMNKENIKLIPIFANEKLKEVIS